MIIQDNGDRHYKTDHGVYVIVNYQDGSFDANVWEIFAPKGRNFDSCHSYIESSLSDARSFIGAADRICDDTCGCGYVDEVVEG
jgi:hypothetical protein